MSTQQKQDDKNEKNEGGTTFSPITSQEEFDRLIKERIERAKKSAVPDDYEAMKAKAAKFDEIEEANKSELEKATSRAEAAEKELATLRHQAELDGWKAAASQATGVPASVLRGDTEEEIMAHAEVIKGAITIYPQVKETGTKPQTMTREEILNIEDTEERQAAIASHPELF